MAPKREKRRHEPNGVADNQPHKPMHRHCFLQTLMARGWLPEEDAKQIYKDLLKTGSESKYSDLIVDINRDLELVQLAVRRILYPLDGKWYVGLVNKVQDEHSKIASRLSHPEREFFRALMEALAMTPGSADGMASIGSIEAGNLSLTASQASQPAPTQRAPKMTISEKGAALKKLVEEGWLAVPPEQTGRYSIGARTFLELSEYLLSMELPAETRSAWEKFL